MIAFVFPGQGSQAQGMGAEWRDHPSWELVAEASEASGRDLAHLLLEADDEELRETRNAQLATFTTSIVAYDAITRVGLAPSGYAGHSLGEYSALTAAGALDLGDAARLVAERGEAMQVAADESQGTMAAILGLDDEVVVATLAETDGEVWVANHNAPGQVVIAGHPDAVAAASDALKAAGAKRAMQLVVGGAFHTPYMEPAQDRLDKALGLVEFRDPDHPVYANVDAAAHATAYEWNQLLARQLCSPVLWRPLIEQLLSDGFDTIVEVGNGAALSGMAKRISKELTILRVNQPADVDTLLKALGAPAAAELELPEGEMLYANERLVVSPSGGIFEPVENVADGTIIANGELIGTVSGIEVRSAFAGQVMGFMAVRDERVIENQPIAWLRTV
jgi:[acyl-carrier-protein] S-malonyltransferase